MTKTFTINSTNLEDFKRNSQTLLKDVEEVIIEYDFFDLTSINSESKNFISIVKQLSLENSIKKLVLKDTAIETTGLTILLSNLNPNINELVIDNKKTLEIDDFFELSYSAVQSLHLLDNTNVTKFTFKNMQPMQNTDINCVYSLLYYTKISNLNFEGNRWLFRQFKEENPYNAEANEISKLLNLNLNNTKPNTQDLIKLFHRLLQISELEHLALNNNNIKSEDTQFIINYLDESRQIWTSGWSGTSKYIRVLELENNLLDKQAGQDLLRFLKNAKSEGKLKYLYKIALDGNKISKETIEKINNELKENIALNKLFNAIEDNVCSINFTGDEHHIIESRKADIEEFFKHKLKNKDYTQEQIDKVNKLVKKDYIQKQFDRSTSNPVKRRASWTEGMMDDLKKPNTNSNSRSF